MGVQERGMDVAAARSGRRVRVLVVEDEAITAIDLEQLLGELGYAVTGTARSAMEAITMAETGRPDLALMDIRLDQGTDGVEAAREIRDRFAVPSVFLTSHSDAATFQRAHAIEPLGFVLKPYSKPQLDAALRMALDRLAEQEAGHDDAKAPRPLE
jgi:CheY-like chemotaxis protein